MGDVVGKSGECVLTLWEIKKREGAGNLAEAQYAVIRREFATSHEMCVLGQVVHVDRGEADHYLYQSESLRIGCGYHKVNCVSVNRQGITVERYRDADEVTAGLKFELD